MSTLSYDVAPDDQLQAVARRFGLAPAEVFSLDPRRQRGTSTTVYSDETLNLDTVDR